MATVDLSIQDDISLGLLMFVICLSVPLMLTIMFGNGIVIFSIYRKRELAKTPSNVFISSLALFDFLTGLIGFPAAIVGYILRRQFLYMEKCGIWYFAPIITFIQVSVLNLIVITLDRFIASKYPLRYHVWMSPGRAFQICVFVDVVGIFFGSISFTVTAVAAIFKSSPNVTYEYDCGQSPLYEYYGEPVLNYQIIITGMTIPILFILYGHIFTIVSKKAKEAATRHGKRVSTREMKVTKTTAIVLLAYTLCLAPTILKGTVHGYINNGSTWLVWYPWFSDFICISNSMVNPFIYARRSKVLRQEFKETVNFIIRKVCLTKTESNE